MAYIREATPHHFTLGEAQGPVRLNSSGCRRGCPRHKAINGMLLLWPLRWAHLGRASFLIIDRFLPPIDIIVADGIIHGAAKPKAKLTKQQQQQQKEKLQVISLAIA